ncbi:hypothetical protein [Streptomyces pseudogriseolus]|uniref:hypothetical protein n=1 Tax=Streptomyces pseudogriseolus TaxID=36817 RepID=UPI000348D6E6|nr:hypothetical protein [Streptomyces gancidicus]
MTATPVPTTAAPAGPPVPFDPELARALAAINEVLPPDVFAGLAEDPHQLKAMRRGEEQPEEAFTRGGAFTVQERTVPGPEGAPDITLLICRPARATAPTSAITTPTAAA